LILKGWTEGVEVSCKDSVSKFFVKRSSGGGRGKNSSSETNLYKSEKRQGIKSEGNQRNKPSDKDSSIIDGLEIVKLAVSDNSFSGVVLTGGTGGPFRLLMLWANNWSLFGGLGKESSMLLGEMFLVVVLLRLSSGNSSLQSLSYICIILRLLVSLAISRSTCSFIFESNFSSSLCNSLKDGRLSAYHCQPDGNKKHHYRSSGEIEWKRNDKKEPII